MFLLSIVAIAGGAGPAAGAGAAATAAGNSDISRISQAVASPMVASTLTVIKLGNGSGTVTSDVGAIDCGITCFDTFTDGTVITLTATPAADSQFTGWLGRCTGIGACSFTISGATTAVATFAPLTIGAPTRDIDGTASCDAVTDGILAIRHLFGLSGTPLIGGAVGPGAIRTTATQIGDFLADINPILDIDGNGQVDALTDGLLIVRYQFGLRGASLIAGAIGPNAIRDNATAIEAQFNILPCVVPAVLSISPLAQDYGSVVVGTSSSAVVFTIHNGGTSTSTSGAFSPSLSGPDAASFAITGNTCGTTLAGGASCTVGVTFSPFSPGPKSASLSATATPGGTVSASLSGSALTPASLTISPSVWSFGSIPAGTSSSAKSFTITNTGTAASGLPSVSLSGPDAADFAITGNTCAAPLAGGASCTMSVTFSPTKTGSSTALLGVTATPGGAASATLSGTGI